MKAKLAVLKSSEVKALPEPLRKDYEALMRLTQQKINEIVGEVVGQDSIPIIEFLKDKKNISDFKIADKVDMDIHDVRNILYRLYNKNLVTYYRKKDRQKGWYISYWTFNRKRVKDLIEQLHKEKVEKFTMRLEQEENNHGNFYICPNTCVRVSFDKAVDLDFRCPECGTLLNHQDNSRTIEFLKQKLKEMKKAVKIEA